MCNIFLATSTQISGVSRRGSNEKFTGNGIVNILVPSILANSGWHFLYHQSKPVTLKGYCSKAVRCFAMLADYTFHDVLLVKSN